MEQDEIEKGTGKGKSGEKSFRKKVGKKTDRKLEENGEGARTEGSRKASPEGLLGRMYRL